MWPAERKISVQTGTQLIRDIEQYSPRKGQLGLWWLGQHSFVLKTPSTTIYIDPFLTDLPGRLIPPLLCPEEITNADIVIGTHDHADHIDRDAWPDLAKASPQAKFLVPDVLRKGLARDLNIPAGRFVGLDDRKSVKLGDVKITALASAHEVLAPDPRTGQFACLGVVVEANGRAVYHSGDCCIYEGLLTKLRKWELDLMLLPINGRDARRLAANCIGNMTYQEAADLAGSAGAAGVIPAHYDMFAMNLGQPQEFLDYVSVKYPKMKSRLCRYGERVILPQEL